MVFPLGATTALIRVSVTDDDLIEEPESFTLRLTNLSMGNIDPAAESATATIINNDGKFLVVQFLFTYKVDDG